jgi:alanyl-tRNA synthetase
MPRAAGEIREAFLRFFEQRGHRRVASASLVPEGDPTLLFVNAGMVPFKRVFLGDEVRSYSRAASSQKCMRVSGKHNDLENVGRTSRHLTFFEMLGNFSFGDYFKAEAIEYAWELVTGTLGLAPERLAASVYEQDDEAAELWQRVAGLPSGRVHRLGADENFWSMGDTGPCGPCSEIHMDFGPQAGCPDPAACDPSCDCGRWLEIWNLVFMQFERRADGAQVPLPKPSIDTGMGLDRIAAAVQGVRSVWENDLFRPLIAHVEEIAGASYGEREERDVSLRVVADHARALTFLIGDGVLPSNDGRGYVLRRILRRASRHGVLLGVEEPFVHRVAEVVVDGMAGAYPELVERRAFISQRIRREEERFLETVSKGLALLEDEIRAMRERSETVLPGDVAFKLYDTYGFPVDLTEDILRAEQLSADQAGFERAMAAQRGRARAAWRGSGDEAVKDVYGRIAADVQTVFSGYGTLETRSPVRAILRDGRPEDAAGEGDAVEVVVEETPFYAESGGQVGDRGSIETANALVEVQDTQRPVPGLVVHRGRVVRGGLRLDEEAVLRVDAEARRATVRNHSGTHLLHAALRRVLGPQAVQKGSLVAPDRLRFDFTHDAPLGDEEIERIEDLVNEWIERNAPAGERILPYAEAIASGAVAIFEEKYGDEVRVISFGEVSTELCGGTHAKATGDIGLLKIVSETGIAAGVRRIEAQTGMGALHWMRRQEHALREAAELLRSPADEVPARVEKLLEERRDAERTIEKLRAAQRGSAAGDLVASAREVGGIKVLATRVEDVDARELRAMVDDLRGRLGSGVVLLAAESDGKVALAVGVSPDLIHRLKAGDLVREVAQVVGGGGGGRPDFAQAGGRDPSRIDEAIERFHALVEGSAA